MKIAIYGAGACGEYALQKINTCENSKIEVTVFIDNSPSYYRKLKHNIPIVNSEDFINFYHDAIDGVLVAVTNEIIAQELAVSLLKNDYKTIFLLPENIMKAELPILSENGDFCTYIKPIYSCKPILPYLEYHVSDWCNLKCKRCGHFSNLVIDKTFPDIKEFHRSLNGLKKNFKDIKKFRLMGGEPFANPNLDSYIYLLRKAFPYTDIRLVTNGLLLPKISEYVVKSVRECGAVIDISQYPPTRGIIEEILEFLEKNQLKYQIGKEIKKFCAQICSIEERDFEQIFLNCLNRTCYFLREGRLYFCPSVALIYENRNFLELEISREMMLSNSFDLSIEKESGWEMLEKMFYPNDFCKYCTNVQWHEWSITKEIKKEDWFAK